VQVQTMPQQIRVPEIGENIESGEVVTVMVAVGDVVAVDQPLAELETDKAVLELPSPVAGRVTNILIAPGDTVQIGQVVVELEGSDDTPAAKTDVATAAGSKAESARRSAPEKPRAESTSASMAEPESKTSDPEVALAAPGVSASPAVRRLARELGVDLGRLIGSGTGGRISTDDVKLYVRDVMTGAASLAASAEAPPLPDFDRFGAVGHESLSKVRKITGENMTTSWTTIPHVTQHDHADITRLEAFRRNAADKVEAQGGKLTVTAILTKVCAAALSAHPRFNSSLDWPNRELILKQYVNIGIAVDTERGLIVPVVQDADKKSLTQIAVEITDLATRTRNKRVKPDELDGGNFTISNLGGIGGTAFTPIVYAPQVAILGVARTQKELKMVDGQPQERLMLPLALSYDHRVIDGAEGARFIRWIVLALENPYLAVLGA
jgi:pyruvate dehydrogenase E2 component (dihydrolipoamide acetyltransferase)